MLDVKIRPCIDIHNGKVKQIVGSTLRDNDARSEDNGKKKPEGNRTDQGQSSAAENYVSERDAAYYASVYKEKGLSGGHIILLNSRNDRAAYEADRKQALHALRTYPGGMQVGGGITPQTAGDFLDAGASHVIVTSYVFKDGALDESALSRLLEAVGRDRLVLDLSCRRRPDGQYAVVTDRWQKFTGLCISEEVLEELSGKCNEFLIHAADVEGKRAGVEQDLVRLLGNWQLKSGFPITYAGGVHSIQDLSLIRKLSGGKMDVTVGSALSLFGGDLALDDLVRVCRNS